LPKKYETNKVSFEKHIKKLNELLLIYENYNNYLRENSKYDFNDMINFVLESFRDDSDLRYHYAEKFNYIMVDEYQDTNNAQNTIFDLILNTSLEA
jgi:DNA helicase II / ATP-dependent DNA helicase PcrA